MGGRRYVAGLSGVGRGSIAGQQRDRMGLNKIRLPNGISDSLIRYSGLLLVEGDALEVGDGDVVLLEDILDEFF